LNDFRELPSYDCFSTWYELAVFRIGKLYQGRKQVAMHAAGIAGTCQRFEQFSDCVSFSFFHFRSLTGTGI